MHAAQLCGAVAGPSARAVNTLYARMRHQMPNSIKAMMLGRQNAPYARNEQICKNST
jgi:hypothetical protein